MKTLIVGSSHLDHQQLIDYIAWADQTIACDGGYDHFQAVAVRPDIVLGDQDSIQSEIEPTIRFQAEKDFTDLEAALQLAAKSSHEIIVLGATGGRLDHFLSAVMQLFQYDIPVRLIDLQNEIWVQKTSFQFERTDFRYFSLIVLDPIRLSIRGAKYELDQVLINPYSGQTVSNEAKGVVAVEFESGRVIVVLSRDTKKTPIGV